MQMWVTVMYVVIMMWVDVGGDHGDAGSDHMVVVHTPSMYQWLFMM